MYATANLQDRYKQDYVTTASPIDLIIMLYDGCIKQLKLAKIHKEDNRLDQISVCLEKAEEIVLELVRSLNFKIDISNDLVQLYEFMLNEMVSCNMTNEVEKLEPVIDMLTTLKDAWVQVKSGVDNGANYSYDDSEESV